MSLAKTLDWMNLVADHVVARSRHDAALRAQFLRHPRAVLQEAGAQLPPHVRVNVVEDSPLVTHLILPPGDRRTYEAIVLEVTSHLPASTRVEILQNSATDVYYKLPRPEQLDSRRESMPSHDGRQPPAPCFPHGTWASGYAGEVGEPPPAVAQVKRFMEWYAADQSVRDDCLREPDSLAARLHMEVDPGVLRPIWDPDDESPAVAPMVQQYWDFLRRLERSGEQMRVECTPAHARMATWRERQIARCSFELPAAWNEACKHFTLTVELSRGCSVGCRFCGVAAPKLTEVWPYTEENAALWCDILRGLRGVLGEAGQHGMCYWATDPMDNPEYEQFCHDYAHLMGRFPCTTTALALKNIERTRALLALSREHGCLSNRFSLLTLGQVRKVMQAFSAEELLHVELLFLNAESDGVKVAAGRGREGNKVPTKAGTIACVSGFHLNMVDRTLQLMTPCMADEQRPLGYRVVARGRFDTLTEFTDLLQRMTSAHCMPDHLSLHQKLRFHPALSFEVLDPNVFRLSSRFGEVLNFASQGYPPMVSLGNMLHQGYRTVADIAGAVTGAPRSTTLYVLEQMFAMGLFEEQTETIELA